MEVFTRMNLLADIDQWDYNTIYRLVTQRDAEPGVYDFKGALNAKGTSESTNELNESIRKTVCSMANADGGYIIFGVKDPTKYPNLTAEQRIIGIPKSFEYLRDFGVKISVIQRHVSCVYPGKLIDLPDDDTLGIFVVYVPLSPLRPHMIEGKFYKRIGTGSAVQMDWYEVRDQMLYTEGRLQKVRLLRLKIAQFSKLWRQQAGSGFDWGELAMHRRYETSEFESLVADICDLIPSQSNLLEDLLELSSTARAMNAAINRNISIVGHAIDAIRGEEGNKLGKLCVECENQLAEIFAPLTIDNT